MALLPSVLYPISTALLASGLHARISSRFATVIRVAEIVKLIITELRSRPPSHCKNQFKLTHAWLNLWDKHILLAGSTRYLTQSLKARRKRFLCEKTAPALAHRHLPCCPFSHSFPSCADPQLLSQSKLPDHTGTLPDTNDAPFSAAAASWLAQTSSLRPHKRDPTTTSTRQFYGI